MIAKLVYGPFDVAPLTGETVALSIKSDMAHTGNYMSSINNILIKCFKSFRKLIVSNFQCLVEKFTIQKC